MKKKIVPETIMKGMRPFVINDGTAGSIVSGSGSNSLIRIKMVVKIKPETSAYLPAILPFSDRNQIPWLSSFSLIYGNQKLPSIIVTGKTTTAKKG